MKALVLIHGKSERQSIVSQSLKSELQRFNIDCDICDNSLFFADTSIPMQTLSEYLCSNCPDFVITTHSSALIAVSDLRTAKNLNFKLFHIQDDFCHHREYRHFDADIYFLPSEHFVNDYKDNIAESSLLCLGIPTEAVNAQPLFSKGLSNEKVCAVFADCFDFHLILDVCDKVSECCHVILITRGSDTFITKQFREVFYNNNRVSVVSDITFNLSMVSCAIACPYSIYAAVCANAGVPLVILSPTDTYKSEDFINMCDLGLGMGCMNVREAFTAVKSLLSDNSMKSYALYMQRNSTPNNPAKNICKSILDYYKK